MTKRVEAKFKINRRPACNLRGRAKSRLGPPAPCSAGAKYPQGEPRDFAPK